MTNDNPSVRLDSLYVEGLRNLFTQRLELNPQTNVIAGPNGSGKSSILEGVSLLATGRSFRSASVRPVIHHDRDDCVVQARIIQGGAAFSAGIRRTRAGELTLKVNGEPVSSLAQFAALLPTIVLDPTATDLIVGPPEGRRRLLDGALFHVEQGFLDVWRRYQRVLRQRNAALRRGMMGTEDPWLNELVHTGLALTEHRSKLAERLAPVFVDIASELSPELAGVGLSYRPGWDQAVSLEAGLARSRDSDNAQGFTHVGPHRADLRLLWRGRPAADVMSRGQLKVAVIALRLAQGRVMAVGRTGSPLYVVDDIAAELDANHAAQVCDLLRKTGSQVLLTTVNEHEVMGFWAGTPAKLFHVEQGRVTSPDS